MKYLDDFRNGDFAQKFAEQIQQEAQVDRHYQFMEFCGGHTHTIHRYGIPSLLPKNVEMIHGPGCPVCVLPIARIDHAIALATLPNVIFCTYGDMLRVPGSQQNSLLKAKAAGADVRILFAANQALEIAKENPTQSIIFFAIGFETTTPPTAAVLQQARQEDINNFYVFCNHVMTPVAMAALLDTKNKTDSTIRLDGFVGPAHVSIITGSNAYQQVSTQYQKPIVISGFEPLDVLQSILWLVRQVNDSRHEVENQYTRAVNQTGNLKSQALMAETLEKRSTFEWRGLGWIPHSALQIKPEYSDFDAEKHFSVDIQPAKEHKGCDCADVLRGIKKPTDCKLFEKVCTPENPLGSCMVSSEGACAAVYAYGRI